ncbi:unnamed protein product [Hyaloperonospora brassicae]|uniref:RxLR effector candidate protein n=1 Tax=Hyaloperonospora brassicae TaxID=162125 RepID=A0AAV0TPF5_HYABA|nr:unnamed protein product [Hyaloperonospora brassicae]CAI5724128.1 unnamed protein product [Hyaloperonospora brassicae]
MRVYPGILLTAALLATSNSASTASDTPPSVSREAAEKAGGFRHKIPFIYGNMTGTLVITIEPGSLRLTGKEDPVMNGTQMVNFTRIKDLESGGEDRTLFGSAILWNYVLNILEVRYLLRVIKKFAGVFS